MSTKRRWGNMVARESSFKTKALGNEHKGDLTREKESFWKRTFWRRHR